MFICTTLWTGKALAVYSTKTAQAVGCKRLCWGYNGGSCSKRKGGKDLPFCLAHIPRNKRQHNRKQFLASGELTLRRRDGKRRHQAQLQEGRHQPDHKDWACRGGRRTVLGTILVRQCQLYPGISLLKMRKGLCVIFISKIKCYNK